MPRHYMMTVVGRDARAERAVDKAAAKFDEQQGHLESNEVPRHMTTNMTSDEDGFVYVITVMYEVLPDAAE